MLAEFVSRYKNELDDIVAGKVSCWHFRVQCLKCVYFRRNHGDIMSLLMDLRRTEVI